MDTAARLAMWPATGKLSTIFSCLGGGGQGHLGACNTAVLAAWKAYLPLTVFYFSCAADDNVSSETPLELHWSAALSSLPPRGWNLLPSRANIESGTCNDLFLVLFSGTDYFKFFLIQC